MEGSRGIAMYLYLPSGRALMESEGTSWYEILRSMSILTFRTRPEGCKDTPRRGGREGRCLPR